MANDGEPRVTPQTALVLDALMRRQRLSGADLAKLTNLKSGTLYPLLLRLEQAGWLQSEWEAEDPKKLGRPRRRYYLMTGKGAAHGRAAAARNAEIFGRLAWS